MKRTKKQWIIEAILAETKKSQEKSIKKAVSPIFSAVYPKNHKYKKIKCITDNLILRKNEHLEYQQKKIDMQRLCSG